METIHILIEWLVEFVHDFGYIGIFIMTFLESTFVPIPSEVTMVPAGYLIQQGKMEFIPVFIASVIGTIGGSLFNYWIAARYGRRFLYHFGKYMLFSHEKMEKLDRFFASHGEISIFTARLIPGVRHVISFPAGLAHMNLRKFIIYTGVGGALWMAILIAVGYIIGDSKELVRAYMPYITGAMVVSVILMVVVYMVKYRKKSGGSGGIAG